MGMLGSFGQELTRDEEYFDKGLNLSYYNLPVTQTVLHMQGKFLPPVDTAIQQGY